MMNRMLLQRVGGVSPSEDLPFFEDAVFYINRFYDNDITTDGNGRVLEWVNRADINNKLTRVGVLDANLPVDNPVNKTVLIANGTVLRLQSDIFFEATAFSAIVILERDFVGSENELVVGQNTINSSTSVKAVFRGDRDLWLYPKEGLQFIQVPGGSAKPINSFVGKIISCFSVDTQNSQANTDVYTELLQEANTFARNVQVSTTGFINKLRGNRMGAESFKLRSVVYYNRVLNPAELVTVRQYFLTQFPIAEIIE